MTDLVTPRRRVRRVLLGSGLAVVLLLALVAGGVFALSERLGNNVTRIPQAFASLDEALRPPETDGQTFLLIGTDSRPAGTSAPATAATPSDNTLMIAQISADRDHVTIVALPGDSWVDIPGRGPGKINDAYSAEGPGLLVRTVENLTAWRVDNVVVVDFGKFDAVVDAVGGVDVETVGAVRGGHLDGAAAVAFLGPRAAPAGGDRERADRQQVVLRAALAKVVSSGTLTDPVALYNLLDAISRSVSLDDTLTNGGLRSLAFDLRGLRPADFTLLMAPVGEPGQEGAQQVARLDPARATELWAALRDGTAVDYGQRHPEDLLGPAPS